MKTYGQYLHSKSIIYRKYILSDKWKIKREEVFLKKGRLCEKCKSHDHINIHHGSYKNLGNEPIDQLFVLCDDCHEAFHTKYKLGESIMNKTMNFIHGKGWRRHI